MKTLKPVAATIAATPANYTRNVEIDVLARTLWGEARGEGPGGMQAVANVILNRLKIAKSRGRFWWGNDIIGICQKPYQFSCWNKSDPNFHKVQTIDRDDAVFVTALRIAARSLLDVPVDATNGATHYHAIGITPKWTIGITPTATIGHHIFYRFD